MGKLSKILVTLEGQTELRLKLDEALTGKKKEAGEEGADTGKELIRGILGQ
jgi:hypothetical protein